MEVLLALMEKVKLKKNNYIELMKGNKNFLKVPSMQKKAHKMIAQVIEKYEIENIKELFEIHKELNPLIDG